MTKKVFNEKQECWEYYDEHDKLHRDEGPAVEYELKYGLISQYWYIHGKRIGAVTLDDYKIVYYNAEGYYHRDDGTDSPALEYYYGPDKGHREWSRHGKLHRLNGPAAEWPDGEKHWCIHGKLHREDGPAVIFPNGQCKWYLEDVEYTEEEHARMIKLKVYW